MIELKALSKTFQTADGTVDALQDINLTIDDGDIFGIIGMSGAGKSTLVRCINMLERPTSGTVLVGGDDMTALTPAELRQKRRSITMIFQQFNLLMQRNCLKNVCFPMELEGMNKKEAKKKAKELLELVGLPDKALAYPAQLSGGQQQRVAIARALATNPQVLLCDEATSAPPGGRGGGELQPCGDSRQRPRGGTGRRGGGVRQPAVRRGKETCVPERRRNSASAAAKRSAHAYPL